MTTTEPGAHRIHVSYDTTKTGRTLVSAHCLCGKWKGGPCRSLPRLWRLIGNAHPQAIQAPCPTPAKHRYGSRYDAEIAMLNHWQQAGGRRRVPCRVYECSCGSWHTTSRPARDQSGDPNV